MSVASHLSIKVDEYDARIRTFVPYYELMLATIADALRLIGRESPTIVDLGVGTGALAAQCLAVRPAARVFGIDVDAAMLEFARVRLGARPNVELSVGNFLETPLPPCDAIVACVALHHVSTPKAKQTMYAACARALRPGGMLISGDCFPAIDAHLAARQRKQWLQHLEQFYSPAEAEGYLQAWAGEDTYFALEDESAWLRGAGLQPDVLWRADGFAVLAARSPDGQQ